MEVRKLHKRYIKLSYAQSLLTNRRSWSSEKYIPINKPLISEWATDVNALYFNMFLNPLKDLSLCSVFNESFDRCIPT